VHADLSWYDKYGRLSIVPDLSILEVDQLSIIRSIAGGRLPSKQFSFGGNAIILETKFCRNKFGITNGFFRREIKKDIDKIDGLLARLEAEGFPNSLFCYFVIFSKSDEMGSMFQELQNEFTRRQCKLIFRTAGMNRRTSRQIRPNAGQVEDHLRVGRGVSCGGSSCVTAGWEGGDHEDVEVKSHVSSE